MGKKPNYIKQEMNDKYNCKSVKEQHYLAVLDRNSSVLIRVFSPLSCEYVLLVRVGLSSVETAVLKDNSCISKDEVDGAVDVTFFVELAERVDV